MYAKNESEAVIKYWRVFTGEDGQKVVDLEVFDSDNVLSNKPVVGIYGLRPAALARAIAIGKATGAANLEQYVEALNEPENSSLGGDFAPYH